MTLLALVAAPLPAATYFVEQRANNASDANPGTEEAPWKTIARAAAAKELRPADVVLIRTGVYREHVEIKVSGESGRPIIFSAAPKARVVVKGSEMIRGGWKKLSDSPGVKEPFPKAFDGVWMVQLGEEFFADPPFKANYGNKARRWVSQVFINDNKPLQQIGEDPLYRNDQTLRLPSVGRGLAEMIQDSFFFAPSSQTLYLKVQGEPAWYGIEVGVRAYVLSADGVHDVVVRGLELRHNRHPESQRPMASVQRCDRFLFEECRFFGADHMGLGITFSRNCVVRDCDLSYNGNSGLHLGNSADCVVENCTLMFNNYRRFNPGWHAGGMKCIPANQRCTVRGCEVAYNIASSGIWFDAANADIRIVGNACHHNGDSGIFYEVNKDGGLIADNLVYANRGRGIYISGSQNTWVVHNTVAGNSGGIVCMPRGADWPLKNINLLNNLLLQNTLSIEKPARGSDLTLYMGCPEYGPYTRSDKTSHSDFNVFDSGSEPPALRHTWSSNNSLEQWRTRFGEDWHSRLLAVPFQIRGTSFRLNTRAGLDCAGSLPTGLWWRPASPGWVGSSIVKWP